MAKCKEEIRSLARKHTPMALRTLAAIARQPKAPASARVAACEALLNRGWGKPEQPVDVTHDVTAAYLAALESITQLSKSPGLGETLAVVGEEPPAVRH